MTSLSHAHNQPYTRIHNHTRAHTHTQSHACTHTADCAADEGFPQTQAGQTRTVECGEGYTGTMTRVCSPIGAWGTANKDACKGCGESGANVLVNEESRLWWMRNAGVFLPYLTHRRGRGRPAIFLSLALFFAHFHTGSLLTW